MFLLQNWKDVNMKIEINTIKMSVFVKLYLTINAF